MLSRAERADLHIHDLRRAFAASLSQRGYDAKTMMHMSDKTDSNMMKTRGGWTDRALPKGEKRDGAGPKGHPRKAKKKTGKSGVGARGVEPPQSCDH